MMAAQTFARMPGRAPRSLALKQERPYQRRDREAILASIKAHQCILYVLPTGGGKTFVFGAVAKHFVKCGNRVCVVVHKDVLTSQTVKSIAESIGVPETSVGTLKLGKWTNPDAIVVVCMVQSLASKIDRGECDQHFGLVILDEAHRSLAKTHRTVVAHFKAKQATILGVTATSERTDRVLMRELYSNMVRGPSFAELTDWGFIARPIYFAPTKDLLPSLRGAKKSGNDYSMKSISKPCIAVVGGLVKQWKRRAPKDGGTLVFAVDIEHAKAIATEFRSQGVKSVEVATSEDPDAALAAFSRLKAGETKIVVNVMIAVEGYDCPGISCLMIARPTLSKGLHIQMLGRALRKSCGCEERCEHPRPVVLDHTTNTSVFGKAERYHAPGLDEAPEGPAYGAKTVERGCPGCGKLTLATGESCEECGREFRETDKREVVSVDGELVEFDGVEPESKTEPHECMCGCGAISGRLAYTPSAASLRLKSTGTDIWTCKPFTAAYLGYLSYGDRLTKHEYLQLRERLPDADNCDVCGAPLSEKPGAKYVRQRNRLSGNLVACYPCARRKKNHARAFPDLGNNFPLFVRNREFLLRAFSEQSTAVATASVVSAFEHWFSRTKHDSRGVPSRKPEGRVIDMSAAIEAVRRGLPEDAK